MMKAMLEAVCALAKVAGQHILKVRQGALAVETKADKTPVTAADKASADYLVDALQTLYPDIPIVCEETPKPMLSEETAFWSVDPLDGTKEFIAGRDEFTVNIALVRAGYPVLGVIYVPMRRECYFAAEGIGAFKQHEEAVWQPLQTIAVAGEGVLKIVSGRGCARQQLNAFLAQQSKYELTYVGSALKFCLIAQGTVDIYPRWAPTFQWDTAAGQCLVEQAGGALLTLTGERFAYPVGDFLNPYFYAMADASMELPQPLKGNNNDTTG